MTPVHTPIQAFLDDAGVVIMDGGLATELEARGFDLRDPLWSARLLLEAPEAIRAVNEAYLLAGADLVTSASYQASFEGLAGRGIGAEAAAEIMIGSVRLAREARDRFWAEPAHRAGRLRPLVVASIGPYGATLADGSEYRGDDGLSVKALMDFHRPRLAVLASPAAGADLLAFETLPSRREAEAILALLAETAGPPAWLSFSCRDEVHVSSGDRFADCVAMAAGASRLLAIGANCCAPRFLPPLLAAASRLTDKPLAAYPNRGETWDAARGCWLPQDAESAGPEAFAAMARGWFAAGARLVGGCCRTGPADVRAIRAALAGGRAGP